MTTDKHNKRPNVPPLRFPEFTDEWEHRKLSEFTERVTRKNKGQTNLPLTISAQYGLVDQISFFNNKVASADMSNYYLLKKGEFTYNKSYSTDYPLGAIKRLDRYEMGALSTLYICFKINGDIESDFLVHYFESPKWHRGVYEIAGEGARNHGLLNIAVGDFFETQHFRPKSIREQEKIAHFLTLIQHRIEVQSGLIEDLKNIKKYLMEQLFCQPKEKSPRLRLGGMSGEWKRVRLCDVVERVSTRNKTNECTRVLTIAAQYGLIDQQEFFNKQIASSDLTTYYLLHRGDFAYNKSYSSDYPWGAVKRLDNYDEGVLSSLYICFCPNHSIDSDFLRHYFESTKWYRGISEISGEGARNHGLLNMSVDDYFNTMHRFPSIEEQTCISHVLNTFDRKVLIEESILEKLRRQKSYLLNNMFI